MMLLLLTVCWCVVLLVCIINSWAWLVLSNTEDRVGPAPEEWPAVAVLVPARNEEQHLPGCLKALLQLNYPKEKLLIMLGNDASTDATYAVAREWSRQYPQIKVLNITETLGKARGKANVLAQLVHACPAEVSYFFMTDADIRPHPQWIRRMLQALSPGIGLVNGTTAVEGNDSWSKWQQTDWAIALGLSKAYTHIPFVGKTLSAIGNNMLISREAYEATGGYEAFPFSITEDYELLQQVRQKGYEVLQLMDEPSSAATMPIHSFKGLLHQRKRWMTGAMRLPLLMVSLLFMQALFFPAISVILWLKPLWGAVLLLFKLLLQYLLARSVLQRLGYSKQPRSGLLYELYSCLQSLLLLLFYFLPVKINWKDRNYRTNRA